MDTYSDFATYLLEQKQDSVEALLIWAQQVAGTNCPKLSLRQWCMLLEVVDPSCNLKDLARFGLGTAYIEAHSLSPEGAAASRILQLTAAERLSIVIFALHFWKKRGPALPLEQQLSEFCGRPVGEVFA